MSLPPLIPRSVLFGNPDHVSPTISPDGTRIGFVAPEDGVLNVWVGPRDGSTPPVAVTHDRDRGVRQYVFCHDDRHLLYAQDSAGDENWRLYLLDLTATPGTPEAQVRLITPGEGIQARIVAHNRWYPTTVLVGLNDRVPQLHDIHSFDLTTGQLTLVAENPGFAGWLVDHDLAIRGGSTMTPDGGVDIVLGRDGDYRPWLTVPPDDSLLTGIVGFTRSGDAVLVETTIGSNAARLERHDLTTGEVQLLAADDTYDVASYWPHPETREVQAVEFERDRQDIVLLDPALEPHLARVRALGDGDIGIDRRERSGRWWLVTIAPSDGPIHYWVYDTTTGGADYLFPHRSDLATLPAGSLAPMEPFQFTARDGLVVHGYVTFPPGLDRANLPAVLTVHGGPWARDSWGFDSNAQWLANRGYVCVQVNFRSSTGFGKQFVKAGDKQWGLAMQDDLTDAVSHVVAQGWVDPARVGIFGGSYGGYAVLAGATFTPTLYRCGIDIVGPSNLLTLLASVPEYWKPVIAMMHQRVGNPETEAELLRQASPLTHVDAIEMPLLVVQGANDPRVKQAEAEQIVEALRAKGLPHEYLLFDDEGHGLAKPQNREVMYAACETFLAQHLGGRVQQTPPA